MNDRAELMAMLGRWTRRGALRELDRGFARFIASLDASASALALFAAALTSHQLGRGHVCLDLQAALQDPEGHLALPPDAATEWAAWPSGVTLADWRAALAACSWCASERDGCGIASGAGAAGGMTAPTCADGGDDAPPLALAGSRLYLRRYWRHETAVRARIAALAQPAPAALPERIRPLLDALFPPAATHGPDWQKLACALAVRSRLAIITGGPGTGKTTTVARLLALLLALAADAPQPLLIGLAAPTGKAAARLTESLRAALAKLPWGALAAASAPIPMPAATPGALPLPLFLGADDRGSAALRERLLASVGAGAVTLHRLLGQRLYRPIGEPLPLDVLVVDEASMIDLALMDALLAALPPHARLVLLGDKDQLASVEAGAVLGELCRRAEDGHYDAAACGWLAACTGAPPPEALRDAAGLPLDQTVAMLRTSHRFGAASGIGRLAAAVHAGDAAAARALLAADLPDVCRVDLAADDLARDPALRALVLDESGASPAQVLRQMNATRPAPDAPRAAWDGWAAALLRDLARFQCLCALREGPWGVAALNAAIETLLREAGALPLRPAGDWYPGRPVLVTRNDAGLGLMNGDVGLTLRIPARFDEGGQPDSATGLTLRVAFAGGADGGVRWLSAARLPAVETVWAMTVHKAQGSEFDHAALLLPGRMAPVLTRELIYTGLTRARERFTLLGPTGADAILGATLARRARRTGGPLWPPE